MAKWVIGSIAVVIVVLALVGGTMISLARREEAELLARFAEAHQQRLHGATGGIEKAMAAAVEDFRAVVRLLRTASAPERRPDLAAALALVKPFHRIEVFDSARQRVLSVAHANPGPSLEPDPFAAAMAAIAGRAASVPPGALLISPADPRGRFYVFAAALPRDASIPGALAVLVDTKPFFDALRPLRAEPGSHLLVLDPSGRPAPATGAALLPHLGETGLGGAWLRSLLQEMRAGRRGTISFDQGIARRAGLGDDSLVAAYGPIRVEGGGHWSVASLSSTAALRSERRAALLRRGVVSAVLAASVIGLVVFIFYAARRTTMLRDRLRHAAEIEYLHEKTEKILDNIPTGVLALSDAEVTVAANRALRARMPRAALGAPLPQAFPEAPSATILRLRELIERTRASSQVQSLFGEFLALFGEEERYNVHVVPLEPRYPDTRFLLVIEDLSEVRALEGQLLRAEKLATVGVLAAGIAHEIGTPLGVVRGRAEYVLGKLGPGHPQAQGVRVIIEQIDHVTSTMRQLLDFSCVRPAAVRSVAVPAAVRAVLELLRLEAQRRRISMVNETSDTLPDVAADPDQLQQALVNLVINACDACSPGGRVTIRARLEDAAPPTGSRRLRIEVMDDGCGIPKENRHQVFDPFFTTKKRGAGSGLGLSIVGQILRNHRGEIELQSEPGRGTCVTLLWPAAASTPALEVDDGDATQA